MSDELITGTVETTNSVPWYLSTKKTLGVIGAITLYGTFVLMVYGWVKAGMPSDTVGIKEMAKIVALYSGACLGIKAIGGAIQSRK